MSAPEPSAVHPDAQIQELRGELERLELERLVHLGLAESELVLPEATVDEMIDALFEASDKNPSSSPARSSTPRPSATS